MIKEVILYFSEDDNVFNTPPINNPKRLWEAIEKSRVVETNNVAVVDYFRLLVHQRKIDKGVIRYRGEDFELDKHGRYDEAPSFDDDVITTLADLL